MEEWLFDWAKGLNTLTSKMALSNEPPQNPAATISKWAPSCVLVEAYTNFSPEIGCREGSTATPWQVSDSKAAVRSLNSLCLIDGYPL